MECTKRERREIKKLYHEGISFLVQKKIRFYIPNGPKTVSTLARIESVYTQAGFTLLVYTFPSSLPYTWSMKFWEIPNPL